MSFPEIRVGRASNKSIKRGQQPSVKIREKATAKGKREIKHATSFATVLPNPDFEFHPSDQSTHPEKRLNKSEKRE
ncbi:uncharacterized protein CIMG_13053 [Coccidioides immitis RS]|uniref:Uncharacterized protein n=1 Tax=Coccidioides immitis (strain RS) TaxID=246410 RepID=A0A0E1RWP8_COCIM|nr:uncharacterized protein CIMG_13053 [Coccidioides immitis RS]EAS30921.2 hypothetical protein CIMG_13053 [Coccidioides immitis RS]